MPKCRLLKVVSDDNFMQYEVAKETANRQLVRRINRVRLLKGGPCLQALADD
jgi:hypothetical protein